MGFSETWRSASARYRKWYSSLNKPLILISFTITGCLGIACYKIAENFFAVSNPLYVNGMAFFKNNQIVHDVIGEPIKIKSMKGLLQVKLAMKMKDNIDFTVDFKGKNNSGSLTIYGHKKDDEWIIQRVEAKLREQYYYKNFIIYRDATNDAKTIFL